jgi:Uma2 family endonuclease
MTKEAFVAWVRGRETKHEYVDGFPTMMVKVSRGHTIVSRNAVAALLRRLEASRWHVAFEAFSVEIGEIIRFPDVVVEPAGADPKGHGAIDPVLIIEILSPTTTATDMIEKPVEYGALPSVGVYLVLAQDAPVAHVWRRAEDGSWPSLPAEVIGKTAEIAIPALGITLPTAELFAGVPDL